MTKEKVLRIIRGEEFKLSVNDKIDETDIFYDEYIKAARMLDDIVAASDTNLQREWLRPECENNIIAFCGERGEGKSSAMMSFINAAYIYGRDRESSMFIDCENVKRAYFSEPIIIDPTMFDDIHNVLDIVLATLYKKFQCSYEFDNQYFGVNEREQLLDQFQKVYRAVSLINNQTKILDDEYDYEGNIGKLSKLGESTGVKEKLKELIKLYLKVMPGIEGTSGRTGNLLIAIDDLDLCSSNAYKMAEQIRKYLIIPNVIIVMAIKVEQLQLCVQEENFRSYKKVMRIKTQEEGLFSEIDNMAERYVAKLIPRARRIYLPNVQNMLNVKILYVKRSGERIYEGKIGDTVSNTVLNYIFKRTGMKFLSNKLGESFLLPDNLRDTVNLITLLGDMDEPAEDTVYCKNIRKFCLYYEKEWLTRNLDLNDCRELQALIHSIPSRLHEGSEFALRKHYEMTEKRFPVPYMNFYAEKNDSFFKVMNWLENFEKYVFDDSEMRYAYAFRMLYTIRLNELMRNRKFDEMADFVGGYVWAGNFLDVLPNTQNSFNRSRFYLATTEVYNTIAKMFSQDADILLSDTLVSEYYVSKISENKNREINIWTWIFVGMLSNTYCTNTSGEVQFTFDTTPIVFPNYMLIRYLQVSLENFMISLCNLKSLYEKVNMELLGISKEEFVEFIGKIEIYNKDMIDAYRRILLNVDLAVKFKEYCSKNKNVKESGIKDDVKKTEVAVKQFFKNVGKFLEKYADYHTVIQFDSLVIGENVVGEKINISRMYAKLVQSAITISERTTVNEINTGKASILQEFASKLRERTDVEISVKPVSGFLRNKSARNVKINMDNLVSNIQRYYSKNKKEHLTDQEMWRLSDFYEKIIELYYKDSAMKVPDELTLEYKNIVKQYQRTCE